MFLQVPLYTYSGAWGRREERFEEKKPTQGYVKFFFFTLTFPLAKCGLYKAMSTMVLHFLAVNENRLLPPELVVNILVI